MADSVKKIAKPTRRLFDPWNSSSTGHQRAENRLSGSTSWRDSRTRKLKEQFKDRTGNGGKRVADSVGAGSEGFGTDMRTENGGWERGASGLRSRGQESIRKSLKTHRRTEIISPASSGGHASKRRKIGLEPSRVENQSEQNDHTLEDPSTRLAIVPHSQEQRDRESSQQRIGQSKSSAIELTPNQHKLSQNTQLTSSASTVSTDVGFSPVTRASDLDPTLVSHTTLPTVDVFPATYHPPTKPIFAGLDFYINGSTYPIISDHKLKQLIGQHGGKISLGLARRTVTHVIIGELSKNGGAGGGLASSKIQKEATLSTKGENVKFVKAEWVVDSVKQSRRVAEGPYLAQGLGTGGAKQKSISVMMRR